MATSNPDRPRTRAKKACLACNARRVRCNVLEMQPCRNCVSWNLSCELGVSRRGKYPRRKKKAASENESLEAHGIPTTASESRLLQQEPLLDSGPHYAPSAHPVRVGDAIHKTVFLGESSPLTCVVDEGQRSPDKGYACGIQKGRLHYSISELHASAGTSEEIFGQRRKSLQERLIRESALIFPSPAICEVLLQAYFEWFHPLFPILDRSRVQNDYQDETISPLLLQAMLFIGVSLCSDSALKTTGFSNRYKAKGLFYQRAKEIYDVGWETDTMIKLQSIFLLSFWRGGPTEERDVRYWLGTATDLAQKKGMHVMSKLTFLGARDQQVWKRIWWALYVRDQQTSAALGLPSRIRDEDCEVAELDESDFEEDDSTNLSEVFRRPPVAHVNYVIQMARLAKLLREVVSSQYLPGKSKLDNPLRPVLHQRLLDWESDLPPEMQFQPSMAREVMFLVGMLHMTYANLYLLLYRPIFLQPPSQSTSSEGNIALEAATKSTRILEDMLSQNLVQHGSVHLITHTFSALCIHTIHFGRVASTAKKLAEHRAKLCLLGLKELQKSWDLENWVLDLFFHCLDDRTARNLRLIDNGMSASALSSQLTKGPQIPDSSSLDTPCSNTSRPLSPTSADSVLPGLQVTGPLNPMEDASINMDWYELFNVEGEDISGLAGSLTNPDYLNPQNLEFLYRFL
ncbi:uncharacterized protein N7496_010762 [Penicillium cataractarum]|uniref:Zn(2)-C6 fungal-type domain-containing protein n=1 Tax=Penicillium cataractarum TaxID=2100454 RepID=A0A9W9RFI5_9EURO|nr:uncharacterized protein N7496_010762 [Penicillium cataractarum]KAJ5358349.1 hypothetical protein N7496_010762 [Penicillium cataractarum]